MAERGFFLSTGALATVALATGLSTLAIAPALAEDRALLIGVGTYQNLPPDRQLFGPRNDVDLISGLLTGTLGYTPEQIRTLHDSEASKQNVEQVVREWLIEGTEPGDRVFFYFSGHGVQVADVSGDEDDGRDEALAMYDVAPATDGYANILTDDEIDQLFSGIRDRVVTMVFDACHSGTATRSLGAAGVVGARFLPFIGTPPVNVGSKELAFERLVIDEPDSPFISFAAAAPYQLAFEDHRLPQEQRHGVFTGAFVQGLADLKADHNGNNKVSFGELLAYIRKESVDYCGQKDGCVALTPMLEAPDLAYQFEVKPRFTTAAPDDVEVHDLDFNPPPALFTTEYEPVPVQDLTALENLAENNNYTSVAPAYQAPEEDYAPEEVYVEKPSYGDEDYPTEEYAAQTYTAITETLGDLPDAGINLSLETNYLYEGDPLKLTLLSDSSGQLILFDVSDSGQTTQIFPNDFSCKNTPVTVGRPYFMPDDDSCFELNVGGEGGTLLAVVVEEGFDVNKVAPSTRGLAAVLSSEATIAQLIGSLSGTVPEEGEYGWSSRGIKWSYGTIRYDIY